MNRRDVIDLLAGRAAYLRRCLDRFPEHRSERYWRREVKALDFAVGDLAAIEGVPVAEVEQVATEKAEANEQRHAEKVAAEGPATKRMFVDLPAPVVVEVHAAARAAGVHVSDWLRAAVAAALERRSAA